MSQASLFVVPNPQFFSNGGIPLAGGKVYFYSAGTTTPKAVYGDSAATTPLSNPVILDSSGRAKIWLDGYYYVVVKDSLDNLIWSEDNVSSAYSPAAAVSSNSEWSIQSDVLTYINGTQFSVPGDKTLIYTVGRRIKATVTAGIITGTITVSVAGGSPILTTITVLWDLVQVLDSGLSVASIGIISPIASGLPYQVPIGSIFWWNKNLAGVPALPYGWVECNGQVLSDVLSPLNGQTIPNINGLNYFIRGSSTSETIQSDQNKSHGHGLSGTPSTTVFANGVSGIAFTVDGSGSSSTLPAPGANGLGNLTATTTKGTMSVDSSAAGTPDESRPKNISMVAIMRVK